MKLNFSRSALFNTNTKVCLIYFGQDCGTNRDVVPKQRYDRFPSVEDHAHATATFVPAWATPGHTVVRGC